MGVRACPATEPVLEGAEVPAANWLGGEGECYKIALSALGEGRISIAARLRRHRSGRPRGGGTIRVTATGVRRRAGRAAGTGFMLAEMAREDASARAVTRAAAAAKDRGEPIAEVSSIAKWTASDAAMRVATDAVQLLGATGYSRETRVERLMRHAKGAQIYESTNQVHRLTVADEVPRSLE
jgi:alkylation response protein AidB-like acyl-CoA dehydrogenase